MIRHRDAGVEPLLLEFSQRAISDHRVECCINSITLRFLAKLEGQRQRMGQNSGAGNRQLRIVNRRETSNQRVLAQSINTTLLERGECFTRSGETGITFVTQRVRVLQHVGLLAAALDSTGLHASHVSKTGTAGISSSHLSHDAC